ncbi:hypothetical protein LUZ61_002796 [Rhynchospora tenuis]|uniref:Ionotropic glutamate receptor C-terminal domain-containing protein n=1 Tax=Rhynchospora tenuis TaxID=198213 RepID=A0AAD5ZJJ8_9POAL|nr:hypothetical protein LUZ61_002796 [Rhynchospora tenuis]
MAGKRSKTSITMALEDFYKIRDNFSTRIQLEYRDSKSDVVLAASSAYLCNRSHVPLISFTATSPAISHSQLPFFVRASLNDSSQLTPIAAFIQYFGWRAAVPIYEDTDYGADIMPFLVDALQSADTKIPDRVVISTKASDVHIDDELYRLMKQQTRVFVVHMSQELASRFFLRAQAVGMMFEGYVWIVTDSIGDLIDTFEPKVISAMEGVIGFKSHVHMSKKLKSFYIRFKERFRQDHPGTEIVDPSIYQLWAYDAVWALATAVEKVKLTYPSFLVPPSAETSDLSSIGVSQNGPKLLNEILGITFGGLAGNFRIVDGQLQLLAFEIFNVIGKGARRIGFWTPDKGIVREIDPQKANSNANRLRTITWPGDTSELPKGWAVPAYKKPLKIGVPEKNGFSVFVNVSGTTQESVSPSNVTGYCIDVFREVLRNLPYDVSFEFVPYKLGSYNEMVQKVSSKEFDAVVGDVTIRANRTNYGDFTMPYTESGVSMVVPVQKASSQSMWIFVKPFTATLWLMSLTFFIFTGFVVWVIEHRINPEFRGTAWQQFGITYYFAFSTLVFAHSM